MFKHFNILNRLLSYNTYYTHILLALNVSDITILDMACIINEFKTSDQLKVFKMEAYIIVLVYNKMLLLYTVRPRY